MNKIVEISLVKKAKRGDTQALMKLFEAYQNVLYNSAYKLLLNNEDVADCLQETEIKAWKNIQALKDDSAFNSWIFRIMINVVKDFLNKKIDTVEYDEIIANNQINIDSYEIEFNTLSEKYKLPIVLYYYVGFSINEIANLLEVSPNTIKTRLARGKRKLKLEMEE